MATVVAANDVVASEMLVRPNPCRSAKGLGRPDWEGGEGRKGSGSTDGPALAHLPTRITGILPYPPVRRSTMSPARRALPWPARLARLEHPRIRRCAAPVALTRNSDSPAGLGHD